MIPRPPSSTLFPYTTLFRSCRGVRYTRQQAHGSQIPLLYNASIGDRKSTRLNSSHVAISYAVFCLKKKKMRKAARLAKAVEYLLLHLEMITMSRSLSIVEA